MLNISRSGVNVGVVGSDVNIRPEVEPALEVGALMGLLW